MGPALGFLALEFTMAEIEDENPRQQAAGEKISFHSHAAHPPAGGNAKGDMLEFTPTPGFIKKRARGVRQPGKGMDGIVNNS